MAKGKKTGGRQKGTPNKPKPAEVIREALSDILTDYVLGTNDCKTDLIVNLRNDLLMMKADERAKLSKDLLPFVITKLTSMEVEVNEGTSNASKLLASLCTRPES